MNTGTDASETKAKLATKNKTKRNAKLDHLMLRGDEGPDNETSESAKDGEDDCSLANILSTDLRVSSEGYADPQRGESFVQRGQAGQGCAEEEQDFQAELIDRNRQNSLSMTEIEELRRSFQEREYMAHMLPVHRSLTNEMIRIGCFLPRFVRSQLEFLKRASILAAKPVPKTDGKCNTGA